MFEKMMDMVKGQVSGMLDGVEGIPADKKSATVQTTASSLLDGLKGYAAQGGLSSMLGLSKGASSVGGLESNVVSALTSKVGLNPSVAQKIATTVIPAVMSLFKNKVNDASDPGFNLQSMIGGLTGKAAPSTGGGIMGALGGLFKK